MSGRVVGTIVSNNPLLVVCLVPASPHGRAFPSPSPAPSAQASPTPRAAPRCLSDPPKKKSSSTPARLKQLRRAASPRPTYTNCSRAHTSCLCSHPFPLVPLPPPLSPLPSSSPWCDNLTVVSSLAAPLRMVSPSTMQLSRRSLSARSQVLRAAQPLRAGGLSRQPFQRSFRRTYADAASSQAPKPRKRFRFLRTLWRLTWLSGLGLTGALGYSIYQQRHPVEQFEPNPSKKTLVILGMRS